MKLSHLVPVSVLAAILPHTINSAIERASDGTQFQFSKIFDDGFVSRSFQFIGTSFATSEAGNFFSFFSATPTFDAPSYNHFTDGGEFNAIESIGFDFDGRAINGRSIDFPASPRSPMSRSYFPTFLTDGDATYSYYVGPAARSSDKRGDGSYTCQGEDSQFQFSSFPSMQRFERGTSFNS